MRGKERRNRWRWGGRRERRDKKRERRRGVRREKERSEESVGVREPKSIDEWVEEVNTSKRVAINEDRKTRTRTRKKNVFATVASPDPSLSLTRPRA